MENQNQKQLENMNLDMNFDMQAGLEPLEEVKQDDSREKLKKDKEVLKIAASIDLNDQLKLMEYGAETAEAISRFSDQMLHQMRGTASEDSSKMMHELKKLMDQFDKKELEKLEKPKGFLGKLLSGGEKFIERILQKYTSLGREIDKIAQEMGKYRNELMKASQDLAKMYKENQEYYLTLEKYIVAANLRLEHIKNGQLIELEKKAQAGDQVAAMNLNELKSAVNLLEQRVHDLEMASMVSFSTAPQIKMIQETSTKLVGQINSAFITTLPIFKQGIIQAVQNRRNKIIADANQALMDATRERYLKNAQNTAQQSVNITRMSGQSAIKIEDVEEVMAIMIRGMEETKQVEEELRKERQESVKKMAELREQFKKQQNK